MDAVFFKVLHVVGLMGLFLAFGGLISAARSGDAASRRLAILTHGISLVVLFVSGFGLLGKLGLGLPAWAMVKMGIWLLLGLILVGFRKQPQKNGLWWSVVLLLGAAAGFLALYKPF